MSITNTIALPKGAKFPLGQVVITTNAQNQLNAMDVQICLKRHEAGDWGEMAQSDQRENEHALIHEGRLMSTYKDGQGIKFWIITEWDRSVTTVLLPEDY